MSFSYTQPYIVVGAFIVRDSKVLLIQENHAPDKGKWNIPAGKLDFGETIVDGAKREAYEESGIDFTPKAILGITSIYRKDTPGEVHALRIILSGDSSGNVSLEHGEAVNGDPEISDYKWLKLKDVLFMDDGLFRYHDVKYLAQNYLDGNQYPLEAINHMTQDPPN